MGERILVVEDRQAMLGAIKNILEAEGYSVLTATDGVQALELMEDARPSLVLADIMMPRMDGYTLYEEIRARPEWVSIPFIFLTAKSEQEDVLKGKKLGAEDYITKPFEAEELVVAVRSRMARVQAIQDAAEREFAQLKQQIVTLLSHELRTPLTYVSGYTDLALEDASSPDELQSLLQGVKRGADRLTDLVEDLLLLIRLDTGRAEEEFRMIVSLREDLAPVIMRTIRQHKSQADAQGITIEEEVPSDLPPVNLCEPFFVDALSRILDNAIKFSGKEGERVTVSAVSEEEWVKVSVSDEGVGIPPQKIPHAFEQFRQINREQMEQQGAGLGLPIARELIQLHGGQITVESAVGEGSTFTICLPVGETED